HSTHEQSFSTRRNYALAYYNRGNTYSKLKQYERANDDYNRAIELDPQDAWAFGSRGQAYCSLKQYEQAIADFDRAIELDSNLACALASSGQAYRELEY